MSKLVAAVDLSGLHMDDRPQWTVSHFTVSLLMKTTRRQDVNKWRTSLHLSRPVTFAFTAGTANENGQGAYSPVNCFSIGKVSIIAGYGGSTAGIRHITVAARTQPVKVKPKEEPLQIPWMSGPLSIKTNYSKRSWPTRSGQPPPN